MNTKTIAYLIDVAALENGPGEHSLPSSDFLYCNDPKMAWKHTIYDLKSALETYATEIARPECVAAVLVEWSCHGRHSIKHGSYSDRHCSINAQVDKVVIHQERPFKQSKYSSCGRRYHKVDMGDWRDVDCAHIKNYPVGGGNWLAWTPAKLD